jgi:excisionase family DNA binding protein
MESMEGSAVEQGLTSGQVAAMFGVDAGTVVRWARSGKIGTTRTAGGHRRYRLNEVRAEVGGSRSDQLTCGLGHSSTCRFPTQPKACVSASLTAQAECRFSYAASGSACGPGPERRTPAVFVPNRRNFTSDNTGGLWRCR